MTSDACRELRGALGAAALAGDVGDDVALRAHIDGCAECRSELRELTAVARRLELADPGQLDDASTRAPSELGNRVVDRISGARTWQRARKRRRVTLVAAATFVAAAIVALLLLSPNTISDDGVRVDFPTGATVSAHATLRDREVGTEVDLDVAGLPDDGYYWLWLTGDDGDRVAAGTFRGGSHAENVTMTAAIPLAEARRIWVTDADDAVVLDARF